MSDYSFMQSGLAGDYNPQPSIPYEDLIILLGVFTKNSMVNAARHAKLCGRNGVTKEDVQTALKYEVFDFTSNPDTLAELQRIKEEIGREMEEDEAEEEEDEEEEDEAEEEEYEAEAEEEEGPSMAEEFLDELVGDKVVPDDEIQEYSEIDLESAPTDERKFLEKFYNSKKNWATFVPKDNIERAIYSAINATM
jgi:exosome complex component RRP41